MVKNKTPKIKKWTFETNVSKFDKHISNSVPGYEIAWWICKEMCRNFLSKNTVIYDLGCSTGNKTKELATTYYNDYENLKIIGVDIEKNMINYAKKMKGHPSIKYLHEDIRRIKFTKTNIFIVFYTLNFLDQSDKFNLLKKIFKSLKDHGVVFYADKIINDEPVVENITNEIHSLWKLYNFKEKDIFNKNQSIRGVLKPLKTDQIESFVKRAGFKKQILISKILNFNLYMLLK